MLSFACEAAGRGQARSSMATKSDTTAGDHPPSSERMTASLENRAEGLTPRFAKGMAVSAIPFAHRVSARSPAHAKAYLESRALIARAPGPRAVHPHQTPVTPSGGLPWRVPYPPVARPE